METECTSAQLKPTHKWRQAQRLELSTSNCLQLVLTCQTNTAGASEKISRVGRGIERHNMIEAMIMKFNKLDLRFVTFPLECIVALLAFVDQLISDALLTVGRPTPSQCAAFELTSRLDVTRAREVALGKALEEAKVQIAKLSTERDQLIHQVRQVRECHHRTSFYHSQWHM